MSTAKSKMPDLGFTRSGFEGRHDYQKGKELYVAIRDMIERLLALPQLCNKTQREEHLRVFAFNLNKRDTSVLPCVVDGIGSRENNVFRCLTAEVASMVVAYWRFLDEPTEPNLEAVKDHLDYLDHLCREPETIRTIDMKNCRYRITNDRIINGFKMRED